MLKFYDVISSLNFLIDSQFWEITVHSIGRLQDLEAVDVAVLVEVVVPEMLHDHLRLAQGLHVYVLFVHVRFQVSEIAMVHLLCVMQQIIQV